MRARERQVGASAHVMIRADACDEVTFGVERRHVGQSGRRLFVM
jgi:hypothetical protein